MPTQKRKPAEKKEKNKLLSFLGEAVLPLWGGGGSSLRGSAGPLRPPRHSTAAQHASGRPSRRRRARRWTIRYSRTELYRRTAREAPCECERPNTGGDLGGLGDP